MLWQAKATEVEKGRGRRRPRAARFSSSRAVCAAAAATATRPSDGTVADQLLAIASPAGRRAAAAVARHPSSSIVQQAPHGQCFGQFRHRAPKLSEKLVAHVQKNEAFAPGQKVLHWQPDFQRWDAGRIRRKVDGGDGALPKYDIATWKDRAAVERKALLAPDAAGSAALRRAAQLHDVQVVDTMLKAGVSLYTCDDSANTALILACSASHRHEKAAAKPPQRSATRPRASTGSEASGGRRSITPTDRSHSSPELRPRSLSRQTTAGNLTPRDDVVEDSDARETVLHILSKVDYDKSNPHGLRNRLRANAYDLATTAKLARPPRARAQPFRRDLRLEDGAARRQAMGRGDRACMMM